MKAVVALKLNGQIPRHSNYERKISAEYNNKQGKTSRTTIYKFHSNKSIQRILALIFAKDIHVCQGGVNRSDRNKLLSDVSTSSQS